jgi:phosphoesterase RecJ-like protein
VSPDTTRSELSLPDAYAAAVAAINDASEVALACHIGPDGDALGSMLALHHVLLAAGRVSVASFSEPFVVGPHYRELPGLDLLTKPSEFPADPAVMLTFDCGSANRLGDLEPAAKAARELIVVDHHVSNTRFGSINLVDVHAAASAVVVASLIEAIGLPLTRDAAVCLYAALVCDTGRFQYDCTTPAVMDLARQLLEFDVPVARLGRTLFEEHRFAYLQLMADVVRRATLEAEQRFVWAVVTQDDLARHGVGIEETEGLIDIVRRAAEAEVACVLKEEADGSVRVSLRSLGDVDVARIAQENGGGGHRFAAGFTATDGTSDAVERIRRALRDAPRVA